MLDKLFELKESINRKRYIIISLFIISIVGLSITYVLLNSHESVDNTDVVVSNEPEEVKEEIKEKCFVDVKGQVVNSGLYQVDCDNRVNDVINIAGGLKESANTSVINLGKKIRDGMVIVIYSEEEVAKFMEVKKEESIKEEKCKTSTVIVNDACVTKDERIESSENSLPTTNDEVIDSQEAESKMISINTATKEELMTLTGLGEAKALAIIAYREENGPFINIEDIKNVKGIGDKMFDAIKDYITL